MRDAEQLVSRMIAESDRRTLEAERLKTELMRARSAEKDAKEKLLQFLSQPAVEYPPISVSNLESHPYCPWLEMMIIGSLDDGPS